MQAMRFHQLGEPNTLRLDTLPDPTPAPGEICIGVAAAACNFADILVGQGKYQIRPELPFAPGSEVAGTVVAVGAGLEAPKVGTRVLATLPFGGYASQVVTTASNVVPIPASMPFEHAAAFGVAYLTGYLGLVDRGALQRGETLLVHAAAGGVGMAALQIGKALGARVIASAGSEDKLALCRQQGADATINYRDAGWPEQVKELTGGRGADVVYDPVGGDTLHLSTKCIAFNGRIVIIGFASGQIPELKLNRVMLKNIAVTGLHVGAYREHDPKRLREGTSELLALYDDGRIAPIVSATYPLTQAGAALEALAARRSTGKIVLLP
ncbi:MAG: NADPH:quinone oxidoreductase family protein [Myxococcales bacterium]|nr:NADPH:quinone oxidoreductase family protein [Myxococcales bacterium]MDD9965103.1 NADPH:quinone oxidoreductase family protein [Myxococcales bacterium]